MMSNASPGSPGTLLGMLLAQLGVRLVAESELRSRLVGTAVVEDREGAQVFAADGQYLAVVVTALVFDRADIARQECTVLGGQLPQPLQVEDDGVVAGGGA